MEDGSDGGAPAGAPDPNDDWPPYPGEDVPVVDWEIPELRKLIPSDLQEFIGVMAAVVRVYPSIDRKQRRKHPSDIGLYERLSEGLQHWEFACRQESADGGGSLLPRWKVVWYFEDGGERWPMLVVLERRRDGVLALRSAHRRQQSWGLEFKYRPGVVKRGDEG